jgi:hypothetical protein
LYDLEISLVIPGLFHERNSRFPATIFSKCLLHFHLLLADIKYKTAFKKQPNNHSSRYVFKLIEFYCQKNL